MVYTGDILCGVSKTIDHMLSIAPGFNILQSLLHGFYFGKGPLNRWNNKEGDLVIPICDRTA